MENQTYTDYSLVQGKPSDSWNCCKQL